MSRDIRSMMMPKKDAEAIDLKRREEDNESSSSSSSSEEEKKKKKKKHKKHHKKHRRSSSPGDSESELRRKFEREEREEREAERKAEVLDTDGEGDDEGEKFESKLRKNKEVRRVNGEEVLTVAPGSDDPFVVSDDHLSAGEEDAIDQDFYAASVAAEQLQESRRRRKKRAHNDDDDRRAQAVLERFAQRELAELQRDRRIAESSSFAGSDAPSPPAVPTKTEEAMRLRVRKKSAYKNMTDEERFVLWAEVPVLQMLNDRAWERMKADRAFKHVVHVQKAFQRQLRELYDRARKAIRSVDSADMPAWEAAVQKVLSLPTSPDSPALFSWDEQRAERGGLVCSFTGAPIADGAAFHVLTIAGTRYITPQFSYAARIDALAKFCDIYRHIGNSARARLGELTLPDNADMADRIERLFADPEWTAELRAIYTYGARMCNAVVEKYQQQKN